VLLHSTGAAFAVYPGGTTPGPPGAGCAGKAERAMRDPLGALGGVSATISGPTPIG
jgi:hypothetical protein